MNTESGGRDAAGVRARSREEAVWSSLSPCVLCLPPPLSSPKEGDEELKPPANSLGEEPPWKHSLHPGPRGLCYPANST